MGQRFKGSAALVTGAGGGIGREVALALAAEGASVLVNDLGGDPSGHGADKRLADETVQLIQEKGGTAVANYDTVADYTKAEKMVKSCVDNFGRLDILVNVAGIGGGGPITSMNESDFDNIIAVHLKGTFNTCRHALPFMVQQNKGRIINTTSVGWLGLPFTAAYSAAKGGIVSLTYSIAREMKLTSPSVTCNAIAPEALTRLTAHPGLKEARQANYLSGAMSKKRTEILSRGEGPEHIPPIVLYLATDEAAKITGKVFRCGSGVVALHAEPNEMKGIYKDHKKYGCFTLDELVELMPQTLAEEMA